MCHRIRAAMLDPSFQKLTGVIEVYETYIGGKAKNRHGGGVGVGTKRGQGCRGPASKVAVIGAIACKRSVVCQMIEATDASRLEGFVDETIADNIDIVTTDEHAGYSRLTRLGPPHHAVSHSTGEYVRGQIHTSNIDSFWSLIKRGVFGSFHQISTRYCRFISMSSPSGTTTGRTSTCSLPYWRDRDRLRYQETAGLSSQEEEKTRPLERAPDELR